MKLRTFLVEDNPTIRDNLVETLEELTPVLAVGFADSEGAALQWLAQSGNDWSLAIVDMFLVEGSGLGVLAACRNRLPHQRMVVLSNYATPDIRARCAALGADAVFDKSRDIDALIEFCLAHQTRDSGSAALTA